MNANELIEKHGIETILHYMDTEIYNELNEMNNWNNDEEFVNAYLVRHFKKFNDEFIIN